ncbi:MAG: hypothetical protein ABSH28_10605 [Acidobacteriota bacterium]|jgi:hypothetical protein
MTKKWTAINLMLLLGAGLLAWQLNVSVKLFNTSNSISNLVRIQPAKKKGAADGGLSQLQLTKKYTDAEFAVIPAQDLFAESRKLEEKTVDTPPPPPEARVLDIKPILVGVIVSGSQRLAMINDPAPANTPNARRTQNIRLGDNYRGFVVTDITDNGMVLEYGTSREVIPLYDTAKPTQGGKTPIIASRVVNFGAATGAPGQMGMVVTSASAGRPGAPPFPGSSGGARVVQPGGGANQQRATVPIGQQSQQLPAVQAPAPTGVWNQTVDSQGRIIMNSPFGAFPLPNQPAQQPAPPIKK